MIVCIILFHLIKMKQNVILLVLFRPAVIETDIVVRPGGPLEGRPEEKDRASSSHVISFPRVKSIIGLNRLIYCTLNRGDTKWW